MNNDESEKDVEAISIVTCGDDKVNFYFTYFS